MHSYWEKCQLILATFIARILNNDKDVCFWNALVKQKMAFIYYQTSCVNPGFVVRLHVVGHSRKIMSLAAKFSTKNGVCPFSF